MRVVVGQWGELLLAADASVVVSESCAWWLRNDRKPAAASGAHTWLHEGGPKTPAMGRNGVASID